MQIGQKLSSTDVSRNRGRFFKDSKEVTYESTQRFLEEVSDDPFQFLFLVKDVSNQITLQNDPWRFCPEENAYVGMFSVYNIISSHPNSLARSTAEFGRIIYTGNNHKSFLDTVSSKLTKIANIFHLNNYYLETFRWNKRAMLFFGKLGFVYKHEHIDMVCMELEIEER